MHKLRGRFRYFPARAFLQAKELSGDLAGLFRKASVVGGWRATPPAVFTDGCGPQSRPTAFTCLPARPWIPVAASPLGQSWLFGGKTDELPPISKVPV